MTEYDPALVSEKFEQRIAKSNGCWLWTGDKTAGYGRLRVNGVVKRATHVAIFMRDGSWPVKGQSVCHRCDNPPCVNPDHLFVGSQSDNVADMVAKGRHWLAGRAHCANGHEYTPETTSFYKNRRVCRVCDRQRARDPESRRMALHRYYIRKRDAKRVRSDIEQGKA